MSTDPTQPQVEPTLALARKLALAASEEPEADPAPEEARSAVEASTLEHRS